MNEDKIEKTVELKASVSRVWEALTDYRQFGEWFRVKLEAPFEAGKSTKGHILYPRYEHLVMEVVVQKIEPQKYFSFTWHPYAVETKVDYSKEAPTLVEFKLEKLSAGVRLLVTESGFDKIPSHRRAEAFRMNEGGWAEQVKNVERYVAERS